MEISHLPCRLCLSVTDFNVSLFDNYCRKTNMLDKILVCLKLVIEETDHLHTICYKCAESVEKFYDFITFVKKSQTRLCSSEKYDPKRHSEPQPANRRHFTSYVREQVFDADYTFSFLEMCNNDDKKETKNSSPFFSYFSPPNVVVPADPSRGVWKTPRPRSDDIQKSQEKSRLERHNKLERPRQHSRDLFESQSQDAEEVEARCLDWKFTPDESIMRRVREKCFGPSDF